MTPVPRDLEALLSGERSAQQPFPYSGDRWRSWVGHLDGVAPVLESLPLALDRRTTARLVEGLLPGNVAGAFTVVMIWGHGRSGYGPYRTARVLSGAKRPEGVPLSQTVLSQLGQSVDVARNGDAVAGYRFLNTRPGKVAGLGPAFFTKWLHFVRAGGPRSSECPAARCRAVWRGRRAARGSRSA